MRLMFDAASFFGDVLVQSLVFGLGVFLAMYVTLLVGSFLICVKE